MAKNNELKGTAMKNFSNHNHFWLIGRVAFFGGVLHLSLSLNAQEQTGSCDLAWDTMLTEKSSYQTAVLVYETSQQNFLAGTGSLEAVAATKQVVDDTERAYQQAKESYNFSCGYTRHVYQFVGDFSE